MVQACREATGCLQAMSKQEKIHVKSLLPFEARPTKTFAREREKTQSSGEGANLSLI